MTVDFNYDFLLTNGFVKVETRQVWITNVHYTRRSRQARHNEELRRFGLVFPAALRRSLQAWTPDVLLARGLSKFTESKFNAYCELGIAMSNCALSDISEYWSDTRLSDKQLSARQYHGPDFDLHSSSMRLKAQRSIHCTSHCRTILAHFQKRFAEFAIPTGVTSIDKMIVPTKARSREWIYMPPKPDKYGVIFYAIVAWDSLYIHTLWDSVSGNTQPTSPASRYTQQFPTLHTVLYNTLRRDEVAVSTKTVTTTWLL
ncbi:LOW QUALITY PROTEIN: hypothetical protein PHMEG_00017869 [Phytophthora megakarya]|uniref:PiggyBac transposable element-derived protein domain-containing protein n=1 Tax=Phytophthora megakarya TaxID=4795 RepID=A0A225VVR7_9STRA|nr:LOW QUALITY PROTEIN: hypothetical protein PHMEG_00017869 [Phytophthora megakarya]